MAYGNEVRVPLVLQCNCVRHYEYLQALKLGYKPAEAATLLGPPPSIAE